MNKIRLQCYLIQVQKNIIAVSIITILYALLKKDFKTISILVATSLVIYATMAINRQKTEEDILNETIKELKSENEGGSAFKLSIILEKEDSMAKNKLTFKDYMKLAIKRDSFMTIYGVLLYPLFPMIYPLLQNILMNHRIFSGDTESQVAKRSSHPYKTQENVWFRTFIYLTAQSIVPLILIFTIIMIDKDLFKAQQFVSKYSTEGLVTPYLMITIFGLSLLTTINYGRNLKKRAKEVLLTSIKVDKDIKREKHQISGKIKRVTNQLKNGMK